MQFWCPGCDDLHQVDDKWQVNDTGGLLTISPSVLVSRQFSDYAHGRGIVDDRCHSFVRGSHIEFLSDCTHKLAGQTVQLAPLPDWLISEARAEAG